MQEHARKKALIGLTNYIDCFLNMSEGKIMENTIYYAYIYISTYMYVGSMHIICGVYVSNIVFVSALL